MRVEFLLEEDSAANVLRTLLPRVFAPDVVWQLHPHQGKQDLLRSLPAKLRAYSHWLAADDRIIIMCDQNGADCRELKEEILNAARAVALDRRTKVRIAVTELEAWFLGNPVAIENAYGVRANRWRNRRRYRKPDQIPRPSQALDGLLRTLGHGMRYQKRTGSEAIAEHMDPDANLSQSFQVFWKAILDIAPSASSQ